MNWPLTIWNSSRFVHQNDPPMKMNEATMLSKVDEICIASLYGFLPKKTRRKFIKTFTRSENKKKHSGLLFNFTVESDDITKHGFQLKPCLSRRLIGWIFNFRIHTLNRLFKILTKRHKKSACTEIQNIAHTVHDDSDRCKGGVNNLQQKKCARLSPIEWKPEIYQKFTWKCLIFMISSMVWKISEAHIIGVNIRKEASPFSRT